MPTTDLQMIREADRKKMTGLSRVQWWRLERENKVPKRIHLGSNSVGWLKHEIELWISTRAAARR